MGHMSDEYYRAEIAAGRKLMHHPDPEIRRRNKLRVDAAIGRLRQRQLAKAREEPAPPVTPPRSPDR